MGKETTTVTTRERTGEQPVVGLQLETPSPDLHLVEGSPGRKEVGSRILRFTSWSRGRTVDLFRDSS